MIDESILGISADLRQMALVIILTRAGLSLDITDLKKVGRPAVLMCFVPACIEMVGTMSVMSLAGIPVSIALGILLGAVVGYALNGFFRKFHMRDSVKLLIMISISFLFLEIQNRLEGIIPISGLLAIMSMGITIKQKYDVLAKRLSVKYNKLWIAAEIFLFVLVGATVDLKYAVSAGVGAILLILIALVFRMVGVGLSLIGTDLSKKELLFCMLAYTPKATVQAAIGAIPLSMGLECGNVVLTVAVLAILITAPFGALTIDCFYEKLLEK